jgi:Protein of unknown function (DUF3237)
MKTPTLTPVFTYYADFNVDQIGPGPFGNRVIANVTGGELRGEGFKGNIVGAAGDWLLLGEDGFGRLDVRVTVKTSDDAFIYVQYHGLIEVTPAIGAILAGEQADTAFGDQYFFTNPRLETGSERWAWVNHTVFVSQGRLLAGPRVEYQVYRVDNP